MNVAWRFRVELAVVLAVAAAVLASRLRVRTLRPRDLSAEGALLLAVTLAVAGRYVQLMWFAPGVGPPPIGPAWLTGFASGCGLYLVVRAIRVIRAPVEEDEQ